MSEPIPEAVKAATEIIIRVESWKTASFLSASVPSVFELISSTCEEYAKRVNAGFEQELQIKERHLGELQQQLSSLQRERDEWREVGPLIDQRDKAVARAEKAERDLQATRDQSHCEYRVLSKLRSDVKPLLEWIRNCDEDDGTSLVNCFLAAHPELKESP